MLVKLIRILLFLFIGMIFSHSIVIGQSVNEIQWIAEQYPPYNFVQNKKPQGIIFDVLIKMFKIVGVEKKPKDIQFMPWARSYLLVQKQPATALFSMTYTEERAKLFKFVGPVIKSSIFIIAKKDKNLQINSVDDLNSLKIGVVREDIGEQLLRSLKVRKRAIRSSKEARNMLRKLDKGRLDCIAYAKDIAFYTMKQMGIDSQLYQGVYLLKEGTMQYAFHRDTNDQVIQTFQKALDQLKNNGTVDRISAKYLK